MLCELVESFFRLRSHRVLDLAQLYTLDQHESYGSVDPGMGLLDFLAQVFRRNCLSVPPLTCA